MRMTIVHHADPGERFVSDAFRLGGVVPFEVTQDGLPKVRIPARLVAAQVAEHGRSAELTFEIYGALAIPECGCLFGDDHESG